MTAPMAQRPLAWPISFMTLDNSAMRSPAGPMVAARALGSPSSLRSPSRASAFSRPQTEAAERSSARPSLIHRYTGWDDAPRTTTAS